MSRNWMDAYVVKLTNNSYDMVLIHNLLGELVRQLDYKLRDLKQTQAELDKETNEMIFPDCVITFKNDGRNLTFEKWTKGNRSLLGSANVYDNGSAYEVSGNKKPIGSKVKVEEALVEIVNFLLNDVK